MNIVQTVSYEYCTTIYVYVELIRFMCPHIDFNNSTHSNSMLTWTKNTNQLIDWNIIKPYGNSNFWQCYVVTGQFHWINGFLNIVYAVGKILNKLTNATCGTIVAIFSSFYYLCSLLLWRNTNFFQLHWIDKWMCGNVACVHRFHICTFCIFYLVIKLLKKREKEHHEMCRSWSAFEQNWGRGVVCVNNLHQYKISIDQ